MKKILFLVIAFTLLILLVKRVGVDVFYNQNNSLGELNKELLKKRFLELKKINKSQTSKQNLCGNSYLPFVPGANWKYNITSKDQDKILEVSILSEEEEKQPILINLPQDNCSIKSSAFCAPRGIIISNLNFLHILDTTNIITTPEETKGFFIPIDFDRALAWNFEITSENEERESPYRRWRTIEKISFKFKGEEEIEIFKGVTYKTKRIDSIWLITEEKIDVENPENATSNKNSSEVKKISESKTASCTFWLADQTGIVKSIYKEKKMEYPIVLKLKSFQVPAVQMIDN